METGKKRSEDWALGKVSLGFGKSGGTWKCGKERIASQVGKNQENVVAWNWVFRALDYQDSGMSPAHPYLCQLAFAGLQTTPEHSGLKQLFV